MTKEIKKWMVRFSENGIGYNGFRWAEVGEWTIAPDWSHEATCGGGLHGQGMGGWGHCQSGTRFELCEIGEYVIVDNDKVKTNKAKIIAIDADALSLLLQLTAGNFCGYLYLGKYPHKLPDGFTHCGSDLDLI